ncbi:MAG: hypothetical protein FD153_1927 [Rhodospirillaceae bacterium]|nr:MAG: hypothetical protein FD153_1927 [Rhodospirillaceae bacterium]
MLALRTVTYCTENEETPLSRRLLATIGIAVAGVWVPTPFSSAVRRVAEQQRQEPGAFRRMLRMCLKPELLRKAVLRGAYS